MYKAMRKEIQYTIISIFAALMLVQCEDYYVPEIEEMPRALVVEAMLTDEPGYFSVRLSRTSTFDGRSYSYTERNARMYLWSMENESYNFFEQSAGMYRTHDSVFTKPGHHYLLWIETQNGEIYRSETQVMPEKTPIQQIELSDSVFREVNYNYWGEPYVRDFEGIYFSVLPEMPTNTDVGFLYQWKSLINYHVHSAELPLEFNYYCWKKVSSNTIYVYDYYQGLSGNTLLLDNLHFLSYYNISPEPLDSSRFEGTVQQAISHSIYYKLKQHTINSDAAAFWRSVKKQSEASGKLFDPVEEELSSNIYCESNPDICAHGYFYTAATTQKTIAIKLGWHEVRQVYEIDFFPEPHEYEHCEDRPNEFWIYY